MSYEYDATKAERKAAALLREKGWTVQEPTCPICHGFGGTTTYESWSAGSFGGGSLGHEPCPNGCPRPGMFYTFNTSSTLAPTAGG